MRNIMIVSTLIAAVSWTGCSKSKEQSSGTSATGSAAVSGLDVSVRPGGQADVYVTDEKGTRTNGDGATGRVELPDGSSVPLTLSTGGGHMTAPLGDHESHAKHGCDATVHVTPRNGPERVARLDMCRGMDRNRMNGGEMPGMEHGHEMGPGKMGPGSGGMEHGEEMRK